VVSALASINAVSQHWTRFFTTYGWVTACGQVIRLGRLCNQPSMIDSAYYPQWDGKMSVSFQAGL